MYMNQKNVQARRHSYEGPGFSLDMGRCVEAMNVIVNRVVIIIIRGKEVPLSKSR